MFFASAIRFFLLAMVVLLLRGELVPAAAKEPIPGQKPLLLVDGSFQFVPGSWASYQIADAEKGETYQMYIAVLDRVQKKVGRRKLPHCWMEIGVEMPGNPAVVTRILARETTEGPGDLASVIVQVQGMDAFSVPKRFYQNAKDAEAGVANLRPAREIKRLDRSLYIHGQRQFEAWTLDAVSADGQPLRAIVSEELAPIGVYRAQSGSLTMQLTDWGLGATTRIKGTVYPFWLWLASQVEQAARAPEKSP